MPLEPDVAAQFPLRELDPLAFALVDEPIAPGARFNALDPRLLLTQSIGLTRCDLAATNPTLA